MEEPAREHVLVMLPNQRLMVHHGQKFRTFEPVHKAAGHSCANEATCRLQENPLRFIINIYIRFPLSFYMTQQLAQNIEGDFKMWKELLLGENVVREDFCCFLLVMHYASS